MTGASLNLSDCKQSMLSKQIEEIAISKLRGHALKTALHWADEGLVLRKNVPDWFSENGNRFFAREDHKLPKISPHPGVPYSKNALVVMGAASDVGSVMLWGDNPTVVLSPNAALDGGLLACGDSSLILCGCHIVCGPSSHLNARNGGAIVVGDNGLWSAGIRMITDDMHAIRDVHTGKRINPRGGRVLVGSHVWLGLDAALLPGSIVADHCVIGARAVVNGAIEANSVAVGTPARAIRNGITWTYEDEP